MTATFQFEHLFRAPDPAALFAIYFDPDHVAVQDAATGIAAREILEVEDTAAAYRRVCRVTPKRQLPAFMRPFFPGRLHYVERATWRRDQGRIDLDIQPSVLGGRARIASSYVLVAEGSGVVRRVYQGTVSVEVALVGGRIERGIIADIEGSLAITARTTQDHFDRPAARPMTGSATGT